jgi:hypothetical protein
MHHRCYWKRIWVVADGFLLFRQTVLVVLLVVFVSSVLRPMPMSPPTKDDGVYWMVCVQLQPQYQ